MGLLENKWLGQKIKQIRESKGMNQDEVANQLHIKRSTYSVKEITGKFFEKELITIAKLFKLDLENLIKTSRNKVMTSEDSMQFLVQSAMRLEAIEEVKLGALAEMLEYIRKQAGVKGKQTDAKQILDNLTKDIDAALTRRINEL